MKPIKKAIIRGIVVLIPTYIIAYITQKMIYVVPMLAAMGFVAASLFDDNTTKRLDDDDDSSYNEDGDSE